MPFATAFGITLPISRDKWVQTPVLVGEDDDDRADDGTLLTGETTRKREWDATAPVGSEVDREAFRRLLEGDGLHVDFDDATAFAWRGIGPKTVGATFNVSGGVRGGRASLNSGGALEYALRRFMRQPGGSWDPTKGWTLAVFKKLTTADGGDDVTYVDHLATGSVVVARGASANPAGVTQYKNGVAGAWSMGRWLGLASNGDVGIHGYSNANAAAAYDYDELLVWPFALPPSLASSWAAQLAAFRVSSSMGQLPRVLLGGDCITEATLPVRCRMTKAQGEQAMLNGSWASNARVDDLSIREV